MAREMCGAFNTLHSIFSLLQNCKGVLDCAMASQVGKRARVPRLDEVRMREIVQFTARSFETVRPTPFGALIVHTRTGRTLVRATNAVMRENDPSSHAELRAVRLGSKKLKSVSLAGFTMYCTCEPCPMCMSNALWARLDRVVYGATIADANRYCLQIHIPAREVAKRSDMNCVVEGPVARELCKALFTHPKMQKAFRTWSTSKLKSPGR
jgi:tRNA(Arg) A34 adenosine deaminase TadA